MKRTFTLLLCFLFASSYTTKAGTPTMDGTFDGVGVWGPAVSTADGTAGWASANAKKLYVTNDANYYYFGAEVNASDWMGWCFIVNSKTGGASSDSWSRQVNYNHSNKPDNDFRGTFGGYAEFHSWNGTAWTGFTGQPSTEFGEGISGSNVDGFVEVRVPRSTFPGFNSGDVQFYITGDNNDHGSFDAVPNDNNANGWNPPTSTTTLSNYASGIVLPVVLKNFNGILKSNTVSLSWATAAESNLSRFEIEQSADGRNWTKAGTVAGANNANGATYSYTINNFNSNFMLYRLRIIDRNGSYDLSGQVTIKAKGNKGIELLGTISTDVIRVAVHNDAAAIYQNELIGLDGKRISTGIYQHAGGSGVMNVAVPAHAAKGIYFLRVSHDGIQETLKVMVQ